MPCLHAMAGCCVVLSAHILVPYGWGRASRLCKQACIVRIFRMVT